MSRNLLNQLNLNLLKAFSAIYQYRSITQAARHLNMSQAGVSNALKKLRLEMNDQLFVLSGKKLEPTPRAERLGEHIEEILNDLGEHCFPPQLFEPASYSGTITIALSGALIDSIGSVLVPKLHRLLPKAQIKLQHWSMATLTRLESGSIDIGINHYPLPITKGIRQIMVAPDPTCFLIRENHPLLEQEITLEMISRYQLAGMIIPELTEFQTMIQSGLKQWGFKFALRSEHLPALFKTVVDSDLVLLTSNLPASTQVENLSRVSPEWLKSLFSLSVAIYLQQSNNQNPMHQWLVKHIEQVILICVKQTHI